MITYGHEKYIRKAIEGVLMQECNFEVELILANDCSPDQTDEVIQEILLNHPKASWIKYFKHEKNTGMMPNFIDALKKCKGKYVALCEGDDYWTDPFKLQKQVDFLEANPDYVLCFHQVNILKPDGEIVDDFITKVPDNYKTIETLARLGNYIHTPSVVFRNIINDYPFEFKNSPIGDFFLYMMLAQHGKLKYIDEKMSVYRYGVGVFSGNSSLIMAKSNLTLFTCLLSYLKDEKIKKIIFERQLFSVMVLEKIIENQYESFFISNHIFFKTIKFIEDNHRNPSKILKKIITKLLT
ncbi:glycosyltransferase [Flavobacterium sp.]|uniref:glycosyltransferase family 2 protein n=1 Tax=Flavobacterium sp. TaxID=239 RepID=UPI0032667752